MPNTESRTPGTIEDFGHQWTMFDQNTGYYASAEVLQRLLEPLIPADFLKGKNVADVGAGTGRYTLMFHALGAGEITAIEPSAAFEVLVKNTCHLKNVRCLQCTAAEIPAEGYDLVFCAGVLQFIPDDLAALRAMGRALNPEGKLFVWVYGRENNGLYLAFIRPVRYISSKLAPKVLDKLCNWLLVPADAYAWICQKVPFSLPLSLYLKSYFSKMDRYSRKLIIFDQLNPVIARYYTREALHQLFVSAGFQDIRMHHHLGYSWSVTARFVGD